MNAERVVLALMLRSAPTDEAPLEETVEVLERRNMIGVLGGTS